MKNGYLSNTIDSCIKFFLNNKFEPKHDNNTTKDQIYIKITCTGSHGFYIRRNIKQIIKKAFSTVNIKFAYTTLERIGTRFQVKDKIPNDLISNIVYQFKCSSCRLLMSVKPDVTSTLENASI